MQDHNVMHRPAGDSADALMISDTPRFVSCVSVQHSARGGGQLLLLAQER